MCPVLHDITDFIILECHQPAIATFKDLQESQLLCYLLSSLTALGPVVWVNWGLRACPFINKAANIRNMPVSLSKANQGSQWPQAHCWWLSFQKKLVLPDPSWELPGKKNYQIPFERKLLTFGICHVFRQIMPEVKFWNRNSSWHFDCEVFISQLP